MTTLKLKTSLQLLAMAALMVAMLASCDDDDKLPKPVNNTAADQENTNKNPSTQPDWTRLEFPHVNTNDANSTVLIRRVPTYGINYAIEYDLAKRTQRWTCWQWYDGNSGTSWNRNYWDNEKNNPWAMRNLQDYGWGDPFQPDPDLSAETRTELEEYYDCGYQRGHICASADRLNSKKANEQTFYLSNIMPQSRALNTGVWEDMESKVRSWNTRGFRETLYVVKGGTIDKADQIRGYTSSGMLIPGYFFMAVLRQYQANGQSRYKAMGFWIKHQDSYKSQRLSDYVVSVADLEQKTGIDFFCNLPDQTEREVENVTKAQLLSDWGL